MLSVVSKPSLTHFSVLAAASSPPSVGKSKKSHDTVCLLIENDEQMAIACVGMADVNTQITLGISGEVWYLIAYLKPNVGDIKDEDGNIVKQNHAPEFFIKFIAHDLKCNIIVFDLYNKTVEICSGNQLLENNVQCLSQ